MGEWGLSYSPSTELFGKYIGSFRAGCRWLEIQDNLGKLNQERNCWQDNWRNCWRNYDYGVFPSSEELMKVDTFMRSTTGPVCHQNLQILDVRPHNSCKHEYICNCNICSYYHVIVNSCTLGTEWLESPCCQRALTQRGITAYPLHIHCFGLRVKEWGEKKSTHSTVEGVMSC